MPFYRLVKAPEYIEDWISILNKCRYNYSLAAKLTKITTCAMWTNHGAQKSGAQKSISASKLGNVLKI